MSGWISSMLSLTTRKKSASLRSCRPLSATYFSRSLGNRCRFVITRLACASMESTCAGKRPRKPKASRSCSVKAVPLLRSGSRKSAMPRAGSVADEPAFAPLDIFMAFSLSFPKIISERIGDAAQPRSERRQWCQIAGLCGTWAHLSLMPSGYALGCNMPHRRKEFAAGAARRR